jgi:hypothetical protein
MASNRTRVIAVALAATAVAGAAIAATSGSTSPPARDGKAPEARRAFSALSRPDVATPDAEYVARLRKGLGQLDPDIDPATIRLIRRDELADMYAMAGADTVCWTVREHSKDSHIGSAGCAVAAGASSDDAVHASIQYDVGQMFLVSAFAPDGVRDVRVVFKDGSAQELPLANNAAVLRTPKPPARLTWTGADGSAHEHDVALPEGQPPVTG